MMKSRLVVLTGLFLLTLLNCKQNTIDLGNGQSFTIEKNISYGKDKEQKIDIYFPKSFTKDKNAFIIIHGGGWRGGRRSQLTSFTFDLMKKFPEKIFINLDYRLASSKRFALPNQTDDITNAMNYVEKTLKIHPKYILLGNSAGAHLAMLYAYKFDPDREVKAVINIVDPTDLNDPGFKNYDDYAFVEKHLIDPKIVDSKTTLMDFGSPVHWITPTSAPTLSYYGINDHVVPPSQQKTLDSTLTKNKVYHESYQFTGDHLGWDQSSNADFLVNKIEGFMKNINPAQLYKSQNKRFVYEYSFAEDSTQLDIKKREFLNLDIHKNKSLFYSSEIPEQDSLIKIKEKPKGKFPYQGIQYLDVIEKNYPDFNMTLYTSCQNYYQVNMQKKPEWKILPEKEKILNFSVQKAITTLYNRKWTVWFTTDIPIQDGPYLLHGLPGLIVKAEDEKKGISFQLVEIKSLRNSDPKELPYYFRHKLILVTENSFKTILKNYFDNPSPQRNNDNNDLKHFFFDGNGKEISDSEFYRMVERNNKKALEKRNNLLRWDIINN